MLTREFTYYNIPSGLDSSEAPTSRAISTNRLWRELHFACRYEMKVCNLGIVLRALQSLVVELRLEQLVGELL
jgi:hypothetical protein